MTTEAAELSRLRWRSRRGMRELDRLLERYLDLSWAEAEAAEREAFKQLLACEDTLLWPWFVGRASPEDAALNDLVQKIRALPVK